jgi:hypothetical protein
MNAPALWIHVESDVNTIKSSLDLATGLVVSAQSSNQSGQRNSWYLQ